MGGPHPAFVDEDVLIHGYADFIVKGEGEITFPDLLDTIRGGDDLYHVKGISYLVHGKVMRTAPRELVEDLDSLPFPARHLVDISAYKRVGVKYGGKRSVAVLSTSRGCPNECEFCVTPQMYGRRWRARTPPVCPDGTAADLGICELLRTRVEGHKGIFERVCQKRTGIEAVWWQDELTSAFARPGRGRVSRRCWMGSMPQRGSG
jgi:hypothetical protein